MKESKDPTDQLNELGAEGWELVETVEYTGGGTKYLLFKRPAGYDEDAEGCDGSSESSPQEDER